MRKIKADYEHQLKSGELEELYPWLSGSWEEDKLDYKLLHGQSKIDYNFNEEDYE